MSAAPNATCPLQWMSAESYPLTSNRAAALLLGQELYPLYTQWQVDIEDPEQIAIHPYEKIWDQIIQAVRAEGLGGMPSVQTFKAFMNTRRIKEQFYTQYTEQTQGEENSGEREGSADLLITRLCKHSVHPGNTCNATDVCPVCLMKHCINSLVRIAHVWRLVGGPVKPHIPEEEEEAIYYSARQIWYAEKSRWANLVNVYEQFAVGERSWEEDCRRHGFEIPALVRASKSCMEALELITQVPLLVEGWDESFVPQRRVRQRSVEQEVQASSVARERDIGLSSAPPSSPKLNPEVLRHSPGTADETEEPEEQTENSINAADTILPAPDNIMVPPRSPPTSSQSSIYTSSPPSLSSSPPQTSSELQPPPPMFGVHFPDDLPEPSTRRSSCFQRNSLSYEPGPHANALGERWADTSFMSDYSYDDFGNNEEELEEEERIYDSSDYSDESGDDSGDKDENNEEDPTIPWVTGTVGGKRLPGADMESSARRPKFSFSWSKATEAEGGDETGDNAMADEFDDNELEQVMRDILSQTTTTATDPAANAEIPIAASDGAGMRMTSLAEPVTQESSRRRSHDEFNELEEAEEGENAKKHCH